MRINGTIAVSMALFVAMLLSAPGAQGQRPSLDEVARGGVSSDESSELLEFAAPIFKKQRPAMKRVCSMLALDGRAESFAKLLTPLAQSDANCRACGPLGKVFSSACSGARPPKGVPATSQGRLQREPHVLVSAAADDLFRALAEDRESREESAVFVERLVLGLSNPPGVTPGARDYFSLLSESARAPFEHLMPKATEPSQGSRGYLAPLNPLERKQVLDDLF
jgi:hypothetical protein